MLYKILTKADQFKIADYLYVPYQFLQLMGYRLAGKQCAYQWRKYRPEPIGPTSRVQHLIAGIFPTAVCCIILALQIFLSLYLFILYYSPQTPWIALFVLVQPIPFSLYGYLMIFDFLRLRRLLKASPTD
jgi:hypothetical protein